MTNWLLYDGSGEIPLPYHTAVDVEYSRYNIKRWVPAGHVDWARAIFYRISDMENEE